MKSDPINVIRSNYIDPIIEEKNCPFPGLRVLTVFEDEDAADDPLIPDVWYVTTDNQATQDKIPLEKIKYIPKTSKEAILAAKWLIEIESYLKKYGKIEMVEENLPMSCIIEIKAIIYKSHPMCNSIDFFITNYIIKMKDGTWEINLKSD